MSSLDIGDVRPDERVLTRDFGVLALVTFLAVLPAGMLLPTLPLFATAALDAGSVGVGVAVGTTSLTSLILLPVVGRLADQYGRRPFLTAGPLIIASAVSLLHLASSLEILILIRILAGVGESMTVVSTTSVAADRAPVARRGEAFSLFSLPYYGGFAVGPVLAIELLREDHFGLVWAIAASSALGGALLAPRIAESRPSAISLSSGRLLAGSAGFPALILGLAFFSWGGMSAFGALYARELGLNRVGLVFLLLTTTVIVIRIFGRRIPDALGPTKCGTFSLGLIATGLLVAAAWGSLQGFLVATVVFASGQALAFPAFMTLAISRTAPPERSSAVGTVAAAAQASMGAGAIVLGGAVALAGYRAMFVVGALATSLGLVALRASSRTLRDK